MTQSLRSATAGLRFVVLVAAATASTSVNAAPFRLTSPPTEFSDEWPSVAGLGSSFELVWQRFDGHTAKKAILARRFDRNGRGVGQEQFAFAYSTMLGRPRLVRLHEGSVGMVWQHPSNDLVGRLIEPATGTVSPTRVITKPSSAFAHAARSKTGDILVSHTVVDRSDPSNARTVVALTVMSPSFAPIVTNRAVTGSASPVLLLASADHTVVAKGGGGSLNIYRDRNDGTLQMVQASALAAMAPTRTQINTTAMRPSRVEDLAHFGLHAVRLSDGRTAVAWTSPEAATPNGQVLRIRFLDKNGVPLGVDRRLDGSSTGRQVSPRLVALPAGRLGVAWIHDAGGTRSHRIRWYNAGGWPLAAPITLRTDVETEDLAGTQLSLMGDGRVLQIWRGRIGGVQRYAIWGEFLTPPP